MYGSLPYLEAGEGSCATHRLLCSWCPAEVGHLLSINCFEVLQSIYTKYRVAGSMGFRKSVVFKIWLFRLLLVPKSMSSELIGFWRKWCFKPDPVPASKQGNDPEKGQAPRD